jgi:hypothetical protein
MRETIYIFTCYLRRRVTITKGLLYFYIFSTLYTEKREEPSQMLLDFFLLLYSYEQFDFKLPTMPEVADSIPARYCYDYYKKIKRLKSLLITSTSET